MGKKRKRLPEVLTEREVELLRGVPNVKTITGLRARALVEVMLGAGLRVSEVCNLMPRDVDLKRGVVRVNQGKGGRDRIVPFDDTTRGWLAAWAEKRKERGFDGRRALFLTLRKGEAGKKLLPRFCQMLIRRLAKQAGIERKCSPHTLRHSYATQMLKSGLNLRELQELLGHQNVSTTEIYLHVSPDELREKIQGNGRDKGQAMAAEKLLDQFRKLPPEQLTALGEAISAMAESSGGQAEDSLKRPGPRKEPLLGEKETF